MIGGVEVHFLHVFLQLFRNYMQKRLLLWKYLVPLSQINWPYCWPLKMGSNCMGPLICGFFLSSITVTSTCTFIVVVQERTLWVGIDRWGRSTVVTGGASILQEVGAPTALVIHGSAVCAGVFSTPFPFLCLSLKRHSSWNQSVWVPLFYVKVLAEEGAGSTRSVVFSFNFLHSLVSFLKKKMEKTLLILILIMSNL